MPKHKTGNTFPLIKWEVSAVCNEIRAVYVILQKKKFHQKIPQKL